MSALNSADQAVLDKQRAEFVAEVAHWAAVNALAAQHDCGEAKCTVNPKGERIPPGKPQRRPTELGLDAPSGVV